MGSQFDGFINRLSNLRLVFEQKLPAKSSRFLSRIRDAIHKQLNQYDVSIEPTFKFGFVRMKAVDVSDSRMVWFKQFDNPCGKSPIPISAIHSTGKDLRLPSHAHKCFVVVGEPHKVLIRCSLSVTTGSTR
jgi:hypothetical protein